MNTYQGHACGTPTLNRDVILQTLSMQVNTMKSIHFFIGLAFLILFLCTGIHMYFGFPELYGESEEIRMMYRSMHIYILMLSLINLMAANYLSFEKCENKRVIKIAASSLILVAPFLFFIGFIFEPPSYLIVRPYSFWGVIALLVGVMVHSVLNFKKIKQK